MNQKQRTVLEIIMNVSPVRNETFPSIIHHPFYSSEYVSDGTNAISIFDNEKIYKEHKEKMIDFFAKEEIESFLVACNKPYIPFIIKTFEDAEAISHREASDLFALFYQNIEIISQNPNCSYERMLGWLKNADKNILMSETEINQYNALLAMSEEIEIFRGVNSLEYEQGFSWTLCESTAKWFANRFSRNGNGFVLKATVKTKNIIAYLPEAGEQEVLVDYNDLENVIIKENENE